jgi:HNH endonuclease
VRTEAQQATWDNGYRLERGVANGWLHYASTTAPGSIWIAGYSGHGPWLLSIAHSGVAAEISLASVSPPAGPGVATFVFPTIKELHEALDRVYKLAMSLPEAPLDRFKAKTANLPRITEAERLIIQRIGQDIFRSALIDYWNARCPLTGITDPALLRASHIIPWSDCNDQLRLDVHNGLLLSALWDAAFDQGLVSFADDGTPLFGTTLSEIARKTLGAEALSPLHGLRDAYRTNLAVHRSRHGFEN